MADNVTQATVLLTADKASAAATQRLLSTVSADIKALGKSNQLSGLEKSFDQFDATITDTGKRFKKLTQNIDEAKASALSLSKVKIDTFESIPEENFAAPGGGGGTTGGGLGSRLTKAGAQLRNLPSTQIPGLGIGTDAIGNIARLSGALVGVGEKASLVTTVTTALTPALGATSAGIVGLTVAAAPFVIAIGAIGLALKSLSDQAASEAEKINAIVDAQRSVGQDIAKGLTSEEANAKLKELQALRDDEAARIAKLNQEYQGNIESQGALSGVLKVFSGAEDALAGQLDKGKGLVTDYETQIAALTKAMDEGATAANDAAVAEKKRKEEQEKAAKEAEQKEKQRLAEVERIQTQIVDASRKYGEKQEDNARQAGQKIQDIETSAQDKRRDLQVQYQDNLSKLGTKNARDAADAQRKIAQTELDAQLKNRQAEVDSVRNQQRTLEDIRKEGLRNELDALRDRNFLAVAEAGDATKDAVDDANKNAQREAEDRAIQQQREAEQRQVGYAREAQDRAINAQRARADLALSNMQAQRDAKIATDRQFRDAAIAQSRQEEATRLAYDRELQQLSEHLNQKLVLESQEQAAERSLKLGASAEQVLRMGSGGTSGGATTSVNDSRSLTINLQGGGAQLIEDAKRAVLQTMQQVRYR